MGISTLSNADDDDEECREEADEEYWVEETELSVEESAGGCDESLDEDELASF